MFYADCDHELLPVTSGNRLMLAYNLFKVGGEASPPPASSDASDAIRLALTQWGEEEKSTSRLPNKLILPLAHKYTTQSLSFGNLKGRDADIVAVLQDRCGLDLYLALVEKYKITYGNEGDDDCTSETTVSVTKWVAEDGKDVSLPDLKLQMHGNEFLSKLFRKREPDREESEGYTGNDGPTCEQWYYECVCVFWPKSRAVANLCQGDLSEALKLAYRRASDSNDLSALREVCNFASRKYPAGSEEYSPTLPLEMLRVAAELRDGATARTAIDIMGHGPRSLEEADLIVSLAKDLGWEEVGLNLMASVKHADLVSYKDQLSRAASVGPMSYLASSLLLAAAVSEPTLSLMSSPLSSTTSVIPLTEAVIFASAVGAAATKMLVNSKRRSEWWYRENYPTEETIELNARLIFGYTCCEPLCSEFAATVAEFDAFMVASALLVIPNTHSSFKRFLICIYALYYHAFKLFSIANVLFSALAGVFFSKAYPGKSNERLSAKAADVFAHLLAAEIATDLDDVAERASSSDLKALLVNPVVRQASNTPTVERMLKKRISMLTSTKPTRSRDIFRRFKYPADLKVFIS